MGHFSRKDFFLDDHPSCGEPKGCCQLKVYHKHTNHCILQARLDPHQTSHLVEGTGALTPTQGHNPPSQELPLMSVTFTRWFAHKGDVISGPCDNKADL